MSAQVTALPASADSAPYSAQVSKPATFAADLTLVITAWPTLPEPIKTGIVAMVKAAAPKALPVLAGDDLER